MGYDRGDSFPIAFEPNGVPENQMNGKLSPRSYPIQFERKSNTNFYHCIRRTATREVGGSRHHGDPI